MGGRRVAANERYASMYLVCNEREHRAQRHAITMRWAPHTASCTQPCTQSRARTHGASDAPLFWLVATVVYTACRGGVLYVESYS